MIATSRNQFQLVIGGVSPAPNWSCSRSSRRRVAECPGGGEVVIGESRIMPFSNGAMPDRLSGLMAQKKMG
jgi:hypothetical protein